MNSIRVFLIAVILAMIVLFNFLAAIRGYQSSMQEADNLFDKQLLETAKLIANLYNDRNHFSSEISYMDYNSHIAFQVWKDKQLILASTNAPSTAIKELTPDFSFHNFNQYRWRTVGYFSDNHQLWVLAAERTDIRYVLAENVILESVLPIITGLPILGFLIWLIVSHGLKPLRELATELGNKQPEDLSELSITAPKKELEKIVNSSNGLLNRLETSLQREKEFASDAAHELRTPISTLKVQLYNISQLLPEDNIDLKEINQTVERLAHIVEQILALHRNSPDQYNAAFTRINLSELAQHIIAEQIALFDFKEQTIEFDGVPLFIQGDKFSLTTLIQNLLQNAHKYTPKKGFIQLSVSQQDPYILLTVEDSGCGISAADTEAVFKRFYRVNGDRHQSGEPGCGLGLAIVKSIVTLHNAKINIKPSHFKSGTAFTVYFPMHDTINS